MELIDKSAVVAEIDRRITNHNKELQHASEEDFVSSWASDEENQKLALTSLLPFLNTLEVKEVNITEMADDYYDALMKEADWMDEDTIGHCRLAYYTGCKDMLAKLQKGK